MSKRNITWDLGFTQHYKNNKHWVSLMCKLVAFNWNKPKKGEYARAFIMSEKRRKITIIIKIPANNNILPKQPLFLLSTIAVLNGNYQCKQSRICLAKNIHLILFIYIKIYTQMIFSSAIFPTCLAVTQKVFTCSIHHQWLGDLSAWTGSSTNPRPAFIGEIKTWKQTHTKN